MAHAVFLSSKMTGTVDPARLISVMVPEDLDNGCVVKIGAPVIGGEEVFQCEAPAADTALSEIAIIATPEVMYDERKRNMNEFFNEAGSIARGYLYVSHNEFGLTAEGFDGTPAVGNVVELQAGYKLKTGTESAGGTKVGTIVATQNEYFIVHMV